MKEGVVLKMVGRDDRINKGALKKFREVEKATAGNEGVVLNVALDYGGRWDVVRAAAALARDCAQGKLDPADIDEDAVADHLALAGIPDPDLLIRTSGEQRIRNFLLWQCAYSEFYFCDKYWPDFTAEEFKKALDEYALRVRRFGKA